MLTDTEIKTGEVLTITALTMSKRTLDQLPFWAPPQHGPDEPPDETDYQTKWTWLGWVCEGGAETFLVKTEHGHIKRVRWAEAWFLLQNTYQTETLKVSAEHAGLSPHEYLRRKLFEFRDSLPQIIYK